MSDHNAKDILGNLLAAIAASIYVYRFVDIVTDGRLSIEANMLMQQYRERVKAAYGRRQEFLKQRNHVQFEAYDTVTEAGRDTENSDQD